MQLADVLPLLAQAQPDLSITSILDMLSKAGLLGGLVGFVYLLLSDRIYTEGRVKDLLDVYKERIAALEAEVKEKTQDRDDWRAVSKEKVGVVDDAVELAATRLRRRRSDQA